MISNGWLKGIFEMKRLNLGKISDEELKAYISLDWRLYLKVWLFLIIICSEWILDIVLISWLFTHIVPIWLAIIIGTIIGGAFTFPFRVYYTDYTFMNLYYRLAFRKDKIMMSLLEEV